MSTDLTAEIAAFAGDVQTRAAALADRIWANTSDGHLPNAYTGYLTLVGDMLADAARQITRAGLYEPTDLDPADPDSAHVDQLLAEHATAGT